MPSLNVTTFSFVAEAEESTATELDETSLEFLEEDETADGNAHAGQNCADKCF